MSGPFNTIASVFLSANGSHLPLYTLPSPITFKDGATTESLALDLVSYMAVDGTYKSSLTIYQARMELRWADPLPPPPLQTETSWTSGIPLRE